MDMWIDPNFTVTDCANVTFFYLSLGEHMHTFLLRYLPRSGIAELGWYVCDQF